MTDLAKETLQENLLTLLVFDDENGTKVADTVEISNFTGDYQTIAERCIHYRRKYKKAPGKEHVYDLLADILEDENNGKRVVIFQALEAMKQLYENINVKYVLDRMYLFRRQGTLSKVILDSAKLLEKRREDAAPEIEDLWANTLRENRRLKEPRKRYVIGQNLLFGDDGEDGFSVHITGLEHFKLQRKTLTTIAGATGIGKSWLLTHIACRNILAGGTRVLHISLEMDELDCERRLAMMATAQTKEYIREQEQRLRSLDTRFRDWDALNSHMGNFKRYIIERLPARATTVKDVENVIRDFTDVGGRAPDIVTVDHIGLIKVANKDARHIDIAENLTALREQAFEFNAAFVVAAQINRTGAAKQMATGQDLAESYGIKQDSDQLLVLSRPDRNSPTRIVLVDKARGDRDGYCVRIKTDFEHGQFDIGEADDEDAADTGPSSGNSQLDLSEEQLETLRDKMAGGKWRKSIGATDCVHKLIAEVLEIDFESNRKKLKAAVTNFLHNNIFVMITLQDKHRNDREYVEFNAIEK